MALELLLCALKEFRLSYCAMHIGAQVGIKSAKRRIERSEFHREQS